MTPVQTRFFRFLLFLVLPTSAIFPPSAHSADHSPERQKPPTLELNLILTKAVNVHDQYLRTLPIREQSILPLDAVVYGEPFRVCFFVNGLREKEGSVRYRLSLRLTDPNGKSRTIDIPEYHSPLRKSGRIPELLPDQFAVTMVSSDAPGHYRASATISDLNADATATSETQFRLTETPFQKASDIPGKDAGRYYRNLNPANIIPAFRDVMDQLDTIKEEQKQGFNPTPVFSSTYFLLRENPQLHDAFLDYAKTLQDEKLMYAAVIASALGNGLLDKLGPDAKKLVPAQASSIFQIDAVEQAWHVDVLWSEFLATGKHLPLAKIVQSLRFLGTEIDQRKFTALKNPTPAQKKSFAHYLAASSAHWSTRTFTKKNPLIRDYLEAMLEENAPEAQQESTKLVLRLLLELVPPQKQKSPPRPNSNNPVRPLPAK